MKRLPIALVLLCASCATQQQAATPDGPSLDACLWRVLREAGSAPATAEQRAAVAIACGGQ